MGPSPRRPFKGDGRFLGRNGFQVGPGAEGFHAHRKKTATWHRGRPRRSERHRQSLGRGGGRRHCAPPAAEDNREYGSFFFPTRTGKELLGIHSSLSSRRWPPGSISLARASIDRRRRSGLSRSIPMGGRGMPSDDLPSPVPAPYGPRGIHDGKNPGFYHLRISMPGRVPPENPGLGIG